MEATAATAAFCGTGCGAGFGTGCGADFGAGAVTAKKLKYSR
ncbi:hypothetical protein HMPREF0297_1671 [Corynebacterium jeikeium ATCC 43734]|nr:hypothetical protein HMPREF0297_1671 [Corynebacterium jeikeium ATCC 43734]